MKLLLYCTKQKPYLYDHFKTKFFTNKKEIYANSKALSLNGKIVAECDFEVEEHKETTIDWLCMSLREKIIFGKMCEKANIDELECYKYANGKPLYAIHIKNLHIFDKPRELSQYHKPYGCINISCDEKPKKKYLGCSLVRHCKKTQIKNAPQNMMKVESKICDEKDYILISIRPEWLCKILNREKTIEIRKKVLKEMQQDVSNTK